MIINNDNLIKERIEAPDAFDKSIQCACFYDDTSYIYHFNVGDYVNGTYIVSEIGFNPITFTYIYETQVC